MGFIAPAPPPVDIEEWKRLGHLERIKPLAQDWAINGFGTPSFVYLLYIVKLIVYAGGGLLLISATTKGLGGLGNPSSWGTQPIVFRTVLDVALYAGLLAAAVYLLVANTSPDGGATAGRLDPTAVGVLLAFGILLGLRDKVPFLAARA